MTTETDTLGSAGEAHRDDETSRPEPALYSPSFHPLALLFPSMAEQELAELAEDIKTNGQREDIVVMPEPEGRRVRISLPPREGQDFNELLTAGAP